MVLQEHYRTAYQFLWLLEVLGFHTELSNFVLGTFVVKPCQLERGK